MVFRSSSRWRDLKGGPPPSERLEPAVASHFLPLQATQGVPRNLSAVLQLHRRPLLSPYLPTFKLPTLLPAHHASDLRAMLNFNQPNDRCLHGTPPTIVSVFSSSCQELTPFFHLLWSCVSRLGSALVRGERLRVGICYHTCRSP
jgi:hypothetical protein